jgi:hypothetical protein
VQNFIVLGYIPGTNYQINFYGWVAITAAIILAYLLLRTVVRLVRWHNARVQVLASDPYLVGNSVVLE